MTWQAIKDWFRRAWNAGKDCIEIPPKDGEAGVHEVCTSDIMDAQEPKEEPQKVEIQEEKKEGSGDECDCGK